MFFFNVSMLGCFEIMMPESATAEDMDTDFRIVLSTIRFNCDCNGNCLTPFISLTAMSLKSTNFHSFGSSSLVHMNGLCSALEFGMNAPSATAAVNLASMDHDIFTVSLYALIASSAILTRSCSSFII